MLTRVPGGSCSSSCRGAAGAEANPRHLVVADLPTVGIRPLVDLGSDAKARLGRGRGDEIHDGHQAGQRPAAPVGADVREQPGAHGGVVRQRALQLIQQRLQGSVAPRPPMDDRLHDRRVRQRRKLLIGVDSDRGPLHQLSTEALTHDRSYRPTRRDATPSALSCQPLAAALLKTERRIRPVFRRKQRRSFVCLAAGGMQ